MDSKLPLDTLGKIWDLADMDKDGMLDRHEFIVVSMLNSNKKYCFVKYKFLSNVYVYIPNINIPNINILIYK